MNMTATKANWSAVGTFAITLIMALVAKFTGLVAMPEASAIEASLIGLAGALVSAGVAWLVTWFAPANQPKGPTA